jgi:CheY-like chemotaxis protein
MDGFTIAKKVKEDQKTTHIPIIAVSAHAMKGNQERIIAAGCDDYISKPMDHEEILHKIEKWLRN